MLGDNGNQSPQQMIGQVIKRQILALVLPALPFIAIFVIVIVVALMVASFFQSIIGTSSSGGIGFAGTSGCENALEEQWAQFFGDDEEGTTFYKKLNELVEDNPGVDINLATAILTFQTNVTVDKNYTCNLEESEIDEETGEKNVTKEECTEIKEGAEKDSKELYNEAKKIVNGITEGNTQKSDEEIKKWLVDSYLEDRLKELGYELPENEQAKKEELQAKANDIFMIRDMYKELVCEEEEIAVGGSCKFTVKDKTLNNVKVRLLGCTADGNSSGPLEDEDLVDLENYVLGVTYTENGGAPDEAIKMQAIAARSFALTRSYGGKIENQGGNSIIQIRNCTWDQAFCNPDKGCWSNGAGGEYGNTIHSGYDTTKYWQKKPIDKNAKIRSLVSSTSGQVVVDKDGKVLNTPYMQAEQTKWNTMANQGKSVIEMVKATYPNAVEITSNCTAGNGSLHGNPNFNNKTAWTSPNNPYAPGFYGQCTWFAWGRFYEIYGFSPGFTGNGVECARQTVKAHPDKFELSNTPKVGAVGSAERTYPYGHVFIVTGIDGDKITIQEGNLNGSTDSWNVAIKDWQTVTRTMNELRSIYGKVEFANPKVSPK